MINRVTFDLLSAIERRTPPLTEISISVGPSETVSAQTYHWWEMTGRKPSGEQFAVRLLSEHVPMTRHEAPGLIKRYILREYDHRPIEYIDLRSGGPLLPKFDFVG